MSIANYAASIVSSPPGGAIGNIETGFGVAPGTGYDYVVGNGGQSDAQGAPDAAGYCPSNGVPNGSSFGAFAVGWQDAAVPNPVAPTGPLQLTMTTVGTVRDPSFSTLPTSALDETPLMVIVLGSLTNSGNPVAIFGFDFAGGYPGVADGGVYTATDQLSPGSYSAAFAAELAAVNALTNGDPSKVLMSFVLIDKRIVGVDGVAYTPCFDSFQLRINQLEASAMSNNCHIETANCMLIAVPLNAACEIVVDAPVSVTAGVGSMKATVEREEGTDYSAKNFGGQYCGPEQKGVTLEKYLNIEGEFCLIDWNFMATTSGNVASVDADGNTIGYQQLRRLGASQCAGSSRPRFALTVIRAASTGDGGCVAEAGNGATTAVAYTFPNVTDFVWDIPEMADKRAMVPFKARGYASPNIGRGPLNLYPALSVPAAIDPDAFFATYFVNPASLPVVDCDATIAHPAPL